MSGESPTWRYMRGHRPTVDADPAPEGNYKIYVSGGGWIIKSPEQAELVKKHKGVHDKADVLTNVFAELIKEQNQLLNQTRGSDSEVFEELMKRAESVEKSCKRVTKSAAKVKKELKSSDRKLDGDIRGTEHK